MSGAAAEGVTFDGEYVELDDPDADIEQGDILDFLSAEEETEGDWGSHFGVVVTANCDLVHKKHGGILSYVPVVPLQVYARAVTLPHLVDGERQKRRTQLVDTVPPNGWPTHQRLAEMIELGQGVDGVASMLPEDEAAPDVLLALRRLETCLQAERGCRTATSVEAAIVAVRQMQCSLREIDGQKPPKTVSLLKDLAGRLTKTLPGDALFLGRLSPTDDRGYIAYLRLIREVRHDSIATSAVAERRMGQAPAARRVGRLALVYQHRLAQQMARVFSDIGLPEPYEQNWTEVIGMQTEMWGTSLESESLPDQSGVTKP